MNGLNEESVNEKLLEEILHFLARGNESLIKAIFNLIEPEGGVKRESVSIYSYIEWKILSKSVSDATTRDSLVLILKQLDIYNNSIMNLIGYYYDSNLKPNLQSNDITLVLSEVIALLEGAARDKDIQIEPKIGKSRYYLFFDRVLIRRAFFNVLENAIKYSYASDKNSKRFISILAHRHSVNGDWIISVESYGVGILDDEYEKIFDYGYRGKLSNDYGRSGLGLGLAETKRIIEAHGGKVIVKSEDMGGAYKTKFSLLLPAKG